MALDTEMMDSKGRMSPMMQMASMSDDDAKMQAILEVLRKAMGQYAPGGPQGQSYGTSGGPALPSPGGQMFYPMDDSFAPPGYRLNQNQPDPRLLQALQMRQG